MWDSFLKELKGIDQGGAGEELTQSIAPPQAGGVGQNCYHPRSHLHTCPFMWGCYVGQPLPAPAVPPTAPLHHCLGLKEQVRIQTQMQCRPGSVPGLLGLPTAA